MCACEGASSLRLLLLGEEPSTQVLNAQCLAHVRSLLHTKSLVPCTMFLLNCFAVKIARGSVTGPSWRIGHQELRTLLTRHRCASGLILHNVQYSHLQMHLRSQTSTRIAHVVIVVTPAPARRRKMQRRLAAPSRIYPGSDQSW